MMATMETPCEECEGKRFLAEVLDYKLGGRDISEVLAMPVTEAEEFFGTGRPAPPPRTRSCNASPTSASATSPSDSP